MAQQIEAQRIKVKQTIAVNNMRQLALALFEFESEYGAYPNAETVALVKKNTGTDMELKADTADDCFRQLIAANIIAAEAANDILSGGKAPGQAEAAAKPAKWVFSYNASAKAAGNPQRPLAFYPLIQGKTTFDLEALGGKAVILCVDNSVRSFPIDKEGRVMINGKDLFDTEQPYWGNEKMDIKWPAK